MKVTEHVEHLLRQGRKPKELIELGFPKSVVTRVRRQLREKKATPQTEVLEAATQAQTHVQSLLESPEKVAAVWQKLQSMANDLQRIETLVKPLSGVSVLLATAKQLGTYKRE